MRVAEAARRPYGLLLARWEGSSELLQLLRGGGLQASLAGALREVRAGGGGAAKALSRWAEREQELRHLAADADALAWGGRAARGGSGAPPQPERKAVAPVQIEQGGLRLG